MTENIIESAADHDAFRRSLAELITKTVQETLLQLGINSADPEAVQEFQKDVHYTRAKRLRDEALANKMWMTVLVLSLGGIASAIGYALTHIGRSD